jgi:hypothetical protein
LPSLEFLAKEAMSIRLPLGVVFGFVWMKMTRQEKNRVKIPRGKKGLKKILPMPPGKDLRAPGGRVEMFFPYNSEEE